MVWVTLLNVDTTVLFGDAKSKLLLKPLFFPRQDKKTTNEV